MDAFGKPKHSETDYKALWSYMPDGGNTLLSFEVDLKGPIGITIIPTKSGSSAGQWALSESPQITQQGWLVRFAYGQIG